MTRKQWMLLALTVVLAGISLYINRDWFGKDDIQIYHRSRPLRAGFIGGRKGVMPDNPDVDPIVFGFDRKLKLTSLEVVPVSGFETNKYILPLWHLVSESNSAPTKAFVYGMAIKGMHPAVKDATAHALEPDVKYRLFVEAGPIKLEHDFVPVPRTQ